MVPPCSDRISRVPPYSRTLQLSTCTGLSPAMAQLSRRFQFLLQGHWPSPRSLATTSGVSIDVLSSGYLDVSVRRVRLLHLCIQYRIPQSGGFPHSDIHGSKVTPTSPWLFAGCHVLHRLSTPRHSPNALMALVLRKPSHAGENANCSSLRRETNRKRHTRSPSPSEPLASPAGQEPTTHQRFPLDTKLTQMDRIRRTTSRRRHPT